jgi:glycogen(starch) synthase
MSLPASQPDAATDSSQAGSGDVQVSDQTLLVEMSWEACNQVGGIYTVLRSKAPSLTEVFGDRYMLVGPYEVGPAAIEFEAEPADGMLGQAIDALRSQGLKVHHGRWLVTGRPRLLLLDYRDLYAHLDKIKYRLWQDHHIATPADDVLINNTVAFGEACRWLLVALAQADAGRHHMVAHFHEWMSASAIPMLRREHWRGGIVFTTHATVLGRFLAMSGGDYYARLASFDPDTEAAAFNVEPQYRLERAAAHGAHVFTTVSDVTAEECRCLLGRRPDALLPNGLNVRRFEAQHELQNLHRIYKEKIHQFTIGHFFPSYNFDLDNTLYFFSSGRYEPRNKGMDVTIEALARLNYRLQQEDTKVTVVAFIITPRPVKSINVTVLQSRAILAEFRTATAAIQEQVGRNLFAAAVTGSVPDLSELVDDYWLLRLRRTIHSWQQGLPPGLVTYDLVDDSDDLILNQLRAARLWNQQDNPVKVIYHPQFITPACPLFGLEYEQFVRGCHLGIFPSYYEPWGYTPLESIALAVPAVTSDLSGFGSYLHQILPEHDDHGLLVLRRRDVSYEDVVTQLTDHLHRFANLDRRQRVALRSRAESFSVHFDWRRLVAYYHEAYQLAIDRSR